MTHSGETEEPQTAEVAAEALDPLVGQTLDGRFRIVDVIGKGAMGKVYRAVQVPLNRAVALKVLDSRYGAGREESFKQRFLVEAALTAKLNHPNTVRVVDYGSTRDGLFFLAMEYLDGETLERLLSQGPLPWHRVLNIGQQIARALREAHELGVVHRDLKPSNVVLLHADDDADFVKVLDFGLVKSFIDGQELEGRAITQQGMLMGSPPYMAPEQGERNRADPRSDIYSLGTMLFEMLSGKPPFTGSGALEIILKHVNQPVPALVTPAKFEPVPEPFAAIVLRCLAKSPMDRFQSMDELLVAMQDVAVPVREVPAPPPAPTAPSPVVAPVGALAPAAEPVRSVFSPVVLAGFLAAVVVGIGGTWLVLSTRTAPTGKLALKLDSQPSGATVVVDGKALGTTPIQLEQALVEGRAGLSVTLTKEGFEPATFKLQSSAVDLELAPTLVAIPPPPPAPPVPVPVPTVAPVVTPEPPSPAPQPERRKPRLESRKKPLKPAPKPAEEPAPKLPSGLKRPAT